LSQESLLEIGLVGKVFGQFNQPLTFDLLLFVDFGLSFFFKLVSLTD